MADSTSYDDLSKKGANSTLHYGSLDNLAGTATPLPDHWAHASHPGPSGHTRHTGDGNSPGDRSEGRARRRRVYSEKHERSISEEEGEGFEDNYVVITPENAIEAHRMVNNYKFGFKKWKSHVTSRPLSERSDIVKDLYADIAAAKPVRVSTIRPTNLVYVVLIGWWLALVYLLMAAFMTLTVVGWPYAKFCVKMSKYFLWPFGKFIYLTQITPNTESLYFEKDSGQVRAESNHQEDTSLLRSETQVHLSSNRICRREFWCRVCTYPWLILAAPLLVLVHALIIFITWLFVITIPISKVNQKMLMRVMWLPPEQISVGDSGATSLDPKRMRSEIIMFTHQSVNVYYYKYTVDGMNIILVNLLVFVVLSIVLGYADPDNELIDGVTKCILSVLAIVPLTYYIGMAIISISAQSSYAIGALLNATFGSLVELILYIVSLVKGMQKGSGCYAELVRSGLAGTLIGCITFIPGICMVVGGFKYRSQRFNPKSASVTALLLFVAVGGVFAPTLFSKIFGDLQCEKCETNVTSPGPLNNTSGLQCTGCTQSVLGLDGDTSLFDKHIQPLVYCIALLLPLSYICGVVFTLKTHTSYVYDEFYEQMTEDNGNASHHGNAQWSRMKSIIILLICATLIALCADLIAENIQELLESSGISEYFIGVTMIAMIPELPEIINGIQFSLQNNVNLGIEIGTNMAIQVCLIQVPLLVLMNLIYPDLKFLLIFNDVHLWAVIFSVIVINYIFQDGKTDYFQGSALVSIYIILLCMYFFVPTPDSARC